jgi:hypothetical protein
LKIADEYERSKIYSAGHGDERNKSK